MALNSYSIINIYRYYGICTLFLILIDLVTGNMKFKAAWGAHACKGLKESLREENSL